MIYILICFNVGGDCVIDSSFYEREQCYTMFELHREEGLRCTVVSRPIDQEGED